MKITIINGPNLNLLGSRETDIYGDQNFDSFFKSLKSKYPEIDLDYHQSNIEGELINIIQDSRESDGIIINAAAYTHTSVGIADAIAAIKTPVIEVHISNIHSREEFRHNSLISKNVKGIVCGFGLQSYELALKAFV